ncbi:MAG: hypothetical protein LAT76_00170 [Schleiferiaceae bacterium]|nr:hypothetical protein [Schleiferiaceae bacterium]
MRLGCKILIALLTVSFLESCKETAPISGPLWEGSGVAHFLFEQGNSSRQMRIYYFVPENATSTTPVVMVFHGVNRDAVNYRNALITKAKSKEVIIIAPEFSEEQFPSVNAYQLGNLFNDGETATEVLPQPEWTFSCIPNLIQFVKNRIPAQPEAFYYIGHSAGAQFLHRLIYVQPELPLAGAVISAAGWYTLPDDAVSFPYGLGGLPQQAIDLPSIFSKPIKIQVGSNDNDPNASNLRRNTLADAQGLTRVERATYFFNQSQSKAHQLQTPFSWSFHIIPGLNHNAINAVNASVDLLIP